MPDTTCKPLISVCVGSIRGSTLPHLVDSILAQTYRSWELIVAAQGSDPSLHAYLDDLSARDARIRYVRLSNFGRSRALNGAVACAQGDIFAFTDDDCVAAANWLGLIQDSFAREPSVGVVAGNLVPPPRPKLRPSVCPATFTIDHIHRPVDAPNGAPPGWYWGGANFAVRRATFEHVGPFDNYLGTGTDFPSAEDTDFGLRAEALGVEMWTRPQLVIHHTYGRRSGVQQVLRHHRAYAIGSGALVGKLELWGHRLSQGWTPPKMASTALAAALRNPARGALALYKAYYASIGKSRYLAEFILGEDKLSRPRVQAT
jgi:glycosyltransferase involved in cell wall biosynthesis